MVIRHFLFDTAPMIIFKIKVVFTTVDPFIVFDECKK